MFLKLTLLFTTVTLLELSILIPVGKAIGLPATLVLVIGTAVVGGALARRQGAAIWSRIQQELRQGEVPGDSLLDGVAVLIAGTLLLTPGVLTDAAGILLLIPIFRAPVKSLVKSYAKDKIDSSTVTHVRGGAPPGGFGDFGPEAGADREQPRSTRDDIIDVEPAESDDEDPDDEVLEAVPKFQTGTD